MPTIFNPGDTSVPILRWTILPKGTKCVNRVTGATADVLPRSVAESRQVQELVKGGVLTIMSPPAPAPEPPPAPVVEEAPRVVEQPAELEKPAKPVKVSKRKED